MTQHALSTPVTQHALSTTSDLYFRITLRWLSRLHMKGCVLPHLEHVILPHVSLPSQLLQPQQLVEVVTVVLHRQGLLQKGAIRQRMVSNQSPDLCQCGKAALLWTFSYVLRNITWLSCKVRWTLPRPKKIVAT